MSKNTKSLENLIEAEGIIGTSDLHGNYNLVDSVFKKAESENLAVLYNGDIINDYKFEELSEKLGIYSQSKIQMDYLTSKFDEREFQVYNLGKQVEQYSMEALLDTVPKEHQKQAKGELEGILETYNSDIFQQKIKNIETGFIEEKGEFMQENILKSRALYEVFTELEAQRFAEELNKYSDVKVLFNLGNHENAYFVEQTRQYLDNKEQIIDLTHSEGYTRVQNSIGDEISIAGMTNCVQSMPYLNEIFSGEEMEELYSHFNFDALKKGDYLIGNKSVSDINNLEKEINEDFEYKRIKSGNLEEKLDIFVSHGQVGKPMTNSQNAYDVPYFTSAAKLSLESKLTIEGHMHSKYDGLNSFGKNMVRAAGEESIIIKKNSKGELEKSWFNIGKNYNGGSSNPINYDLDMLKTMVEEKFKTYMLQIEEHSSKNSANNESKKAA